MKYIVFDIDGVLADCSHRLHYIQGDNKDYDKFYYYGEIEEDKLLNSGLMLYRAIDWNISKDRERGFGYFNKIQIAFVTGRNESCRLATEDWLENHFMGYFNLHMRPTNDYRPAHEVKEDLIKKHIGFENILFAFDDDDQVNEMYKKHGVTCYKPNITNVV